MARTAWETSSGMHLPGPSEDKWTLMATGGRGLGQIVGVARTTVSSVWPTSSLAHTSRACRDGSGCRTHARKPRDLLVRPGVGKFLRTCRRGLFPWVTSDISSHARATTAVRRRSLASYRNVAMPSDGRTRVREGRKGMVLCVS